MSEFGEPALVGDDLLPTSREERLLGARRLISLWMGLGALPAIYGFVPEHRHLPVVVALGALVTGTILGLLVVDWLSRTAQRYGVGFVVIARLAWGPGGAWPLVLLRWCLGIVMLGGAAWQLGLWMRRLLIAAAGDTLPLGLTPLLEWHLPGKGGVAVLSWLGGGFLLLLAWRLGRKRPNQVTGWAVAGMFLALLGLGAILAFAILRAKGWSQWLARTPSWEGSQVMEALLTALALWIPLAVMSPDWMRFVQPKSGKAARLSMWGGLAGAIIFAVLGALLASASRAVLGKLWGHPVADGAGLHLWMGAVGLVVAVAMFVAVWPLLGVYGGAQALSGLFPRSLSASHGAVFTALFAWLCIPALGYAEARGWGVSILLWLWLPMAGVMLGDVVLRRGRLVLEDAFLWRGAYSGLPGVTLSAVLAFMVGALFHPHLVGWVVGQVGEPGRDLASLLRSPWALAAPWLGAMLAALIYLVLAPLERKTFSALGTSLRNARERRRRQREEAKKPRWVGSTQRAREETNPHFEWDPKAASDATPGDDDLPAEAEEWKD